MKKIDIIQPTAISNPIAYNGDKNSIPENPTGTENASIYEGFPIKTEKPVDEGGEPPVRTDFNGLFFLATDLRVYQQNGGIITFNQNVSNAIGGYPEGAILDYLVGYNLKKVISLVDDNTTDFTQVGVDNVNWKILATGGNNNILDFKFTDYELNDQSWVRSDTFSWQNGNFYKDVYNHLLEDYTNGTATTETIENLAITYYQATDGHKIILASDTTSLTNLESLYANTGIAWFYVLDITNTQFKLPRSKWGFVGYRNEVGGFVNESLPNAKGTFYNVQNTTTNIATGIFDDSEVIQNYTVGGAITVKAGTMKAGLNNYSSVYQDNAPVQQRATQLYLYFYVGSFSQTATEQTAGLNSSLFNEKVDLDGSNFNPTNLTSQAKEILRHLVIPNRNSAPQQITLPYIAPSDGFISISDSNSATGAYITINGNQITDNKLYLGFYALIRKGDIVNTSTGQAGFNCYFSPCDN